MFESKKSVVRFISRKHCVFLPFTKNSWSCLGDSILKFEITSSLTSIQSIIKQVLIAQNIYCCCDEVRNNGNALTEKILGMSHKQWKWCWTMMQNFSRFLFSRILIALVIVSKFWRSLFTTFLTNSDKNFDKRMDYISLNLWIFYAQLWQKKVEIFFPKQVMCFCNRFWNF